MKAQPRHETAERDSHRSMQRGLRDRLNRNVGKQDLRLHLCARPELTRTSASLVN
jgi:hypothetical protein